MFSKVFNTAAWESIKCGQSIWGGTEPASRHDVGQFRAAVVIDIVMFGPQTRIKYNKLLTILY